MKKFSVYAFLFTFLIKACVGLDKSDAFMLSGVVVDSEKKLPVDYKVKVRLYSFKHGLLGHYRFESEILADNNGAFEFLVSGNRYWEIRTITNSEEVIGGGTPTFDIKNFDIDNITISHEKGGKKEYIKIREILKKHSNIQENRNSEVYDKPERKRLRESLRNLDEWK